MITKMLIQKLFHHIVKSLHNAYGQDTCTRRWKHPLFYYKSILNSDPKVAKYNLCSNITLRNYFEDRIKFRWHDVSIFLNVILIF